MASTSNPGPQALQVDYFSASDQFLFTQTAADLLEQQANLDLDAQVDAGLAYQVSQFQSQMKSRAMTAGDRILPAYIGLLSQATAFAALWNAAYQLQRPRLAQAALDAGTRADIAQVYRQLAVQSGHINQQAQALTGDMRVIAGELAPLNAGFNTALSATIAALGAAASASSASIDQLKAAINTNIADIVAGANKTGAAVTELIVKTMTTISDAQGDGKTAPSGDFVVQGIDAAEQGVAETAQARAALNANNARLASAYQQLAGADALVAVAKVVQVQNSQFSSAFHNALDTAQVLAEDWGQSPQAPPATGISAGLAAFADAVAGMASSTDAETLGGQLDYANTAWQLLAASLAPLEQAMTGAS
ncbi:HBL/NHE enterotoxin family protein [Janthinobacterium sp. TB1-E2]|uniref:Haemolytic enterotoxin (HBL) n=2 Tax=Janthinobacterium TaxID=29580 RepID=A0AB38C5X8_9BURK|nr:HBL/NHE enterotoxin family protein [Janthinobacterium lividum]SFX37349.1 haemolytic enterotoxin (HBL) [Janthinobacterium lividum]